MTPAQALAARGCLHFCCSDLGKVFQTGSQAHAELALMQLRDACRELGYELRPILKVWDGRAVAKDAEIRLMARDASVLDIPEGMK